MAGLPYPRVVEVEQKTRAGPQAPLWTVPAFVPSARPSLVSPRVALPTYGAFKSGCPGGSP